MLNWLKNNSFLLAVLVVSSTAIVMMIAQKARIHLKLRLNRTGKLLVLKWLPQQLTKLLKRVKV